MHHPLLTIWLLGSLLQAGGSIIAQENIIFSDSLKLFAEALQVDVDYPVENNLKFNMGDYTIKVDSELGGTNSDTKERLLGLRIVNIITKTKIFTISDSSSNSAVVITEVTNKANSYYPNAVLENFFLEKATSDNFGGVKAWITISGDNGEPWALYVKKGNGDEWIPPFEMLLSRGKERIKLFNVSSDAHFNYAHPRRSLKKMPSMGVEFFQNEKSVCALQYDSGTANNFYFGPGQSFGCKAWMLYDLDSKTKLLLAATMSTLILMNNPILRLIE